MQRKPAAFRRWIAAFVVLVLVLLVWEIIDWRMRPPPPPTPAVSLP
jgi:hypothetical protein